MTTASALSGTSDARSDTRPDAPLIALRRLKELEALRKLIHECPIIDHHAHPILSESATQVPLKSIFSEAQGHALEDAPRTFAGARAISMLSDFYKCEETIEAIEAAIKTTPPTHRSKCFQAVSCVLFDDGIRRDGQLHYSDHDSMLPNPSKRIVRIETLAEDVFKHQADVDGCYGDDAMVNLDTWLGGFQQALARDISHDDVVGFKTVMCYRGGLKWTHIDLDDEKSTGEASELCIAAFNEWLEEHRQTGSIRLNKTILVNTLVKLTCERLSLSKSRKPLQVHTGFGDSDLTLRTSNAAYLESLLKQYPEVQFVLLHANYPYVRECGYLASTYKNVHLDISLVFPMLSKNGQKAVVKQVLELAPTNKILYSSDGHFLPESFLIANLQAREVLEEVLTKRVQRGEMSVKCASDLIRAIFFDNANALYKLGLNFGSSGLCLSPVTQFEDIFGTTPLVRFVRVTWVDYCGQMRLRVLPLREVKNSFDQFKLSMTQASLLLIPNDYPIPQASPVGRYTLRPDWSSVRSADSYAPGHVSVLSWIERETGPLDIDPRTVLKEALEDAANVGLDFLAGFESEFVLYDPSEFYGLDKPDETGVLKPQSGHAWSNTYALTPRLTSVMDEITTALEDSDVRVLMYHPESAPQQFEIVTGPLPPMEAVDALYHTREVIRGIAQRHGLRATFHPKPFPHKTGTATHTHFSLGKRRDEQGHFFAGVLQHLHALYAFGLGTMCSYNRVSDGAWSGGTWVCWGEENRETPLRKISDDDAHWEIRCLDGTANVYLFMATLIHAGLSGLKSKLELSPSCDFDPATLSDDQRKELSIVRRVPTNLEDALKALEQDSTFEARIKKAVIDRYCILRRTEMEHVKKMSNKQRFIWEVERY